MKIVVQRVKEAKVIANDRIVGQIGKGYVLFVALELEDSLKDINKAAEKIAKLRIFEDDEGKMNRDILEEKGAILSVSQFTLSGDVRKGNRPSFVGAMRPEEASLLFNQFNDCLRNYGITVETGLFQTHMNVILDNDGPVTLMIHTSHGKVL